MSTNNSPVAALLLPRENKSLSTFSWAVHDHLLGNVNFPSPTPALTVFAATIDAFDAAETRAATKAKGAAKERDAKKRKLKEELGHLRDYVQSVVEKQTTSHDAAALIESAFMTVRKIGRRARGELSAKNTRVSGTVMLDAKAVASAATYYWQYSQDQRTWISVPEEMRARKVIAGLTARETYYFRFRALTRTGEIGFSQVVSLVVL